MTEEIKFLLDEVKEQMDNSVSHLEKELLKVRAGKASPTMLDGVMVDYYGAATPLGQVANVNTPDAKTISVQPWEKAMLQEIETSIINANLGMNPMNNGEMIMINVPPLTEERRKDLVKQTKIQAENTKISIRNSRKDANVQVKKLLDDGLSEDSAKDTEGQVQLLTNDYIKKTDEIVKIKEQEIMTI